MNALFLWGIVGIWAARLANILYKKKMDFKPKFVLDARYLATICFIILVTDAALFLGSVRYLLMRYAKKT